MSENNKDKAILDDLMDIPFHFIGIFNEMKRDKTLSKKQKYTKIKEYALSHIKKNNDGVVYDEESGRIIIHEDSYIRKILDAYEKFKSF
ncbi:hypothetical protein KY342_02880 [Candidatus Woesearchaeota archaeon]|nr:hypothetical protein [Candidatus Woesearchaeota archaeon]